MVELVRQWIEGRMLLAIKLEIQDMTPPSKVKKKVFTESLKGMTLE